MRITLEVTGAGGALELREWLRGDPELRTRVGGATTGTPPEAEAEPEPEPGTMGGPGEIVSLLLQPGGLTVTLAASVVAWLQTRRGTQSVTLTRPDGTQVVVTSEGVRGLTPESSGELAERVARALEAPARPAPESPAAEPSACERSASESSASGRQEADPGAAGPPDAGRRQDGPPSAGNG
ncbi:hypothetical protein ACIGO8_03725 [Streptomyces sp. NPDC053493]|uniref:effector-associated constant component EACC1 n=1 Tax=Streptomyces sp. NPDC053493 TaxID=3365705 RepID=UPI0037CFDF7E